MAASGINEHHEACRKQHVINRQTFSKRKFMEKMCGSDRDGQNVLSRASRGPPEHLGQVTSYDLEKFHKKNSADVTDRERRRVVQREQYLTYSAKINGRLSSQDYVQQW